MEAVRSTTGKTVLAIGAAFATLAAMTGCTTDTQGPGTGNSGDSEICTSYPAGDIEFVVPYSAGGGFDTWARLIAPVMEGKLPGDVSMPVVNREGAGGITGVSEVYGGQPDGEQIVITEPGILGTTQVSGQVDIDFSQMQAIGRVTVGPEVIVVNANSEWDSIEDVQAVAKDRELLMGTGGLAAVNIISFDALGIPFNNVVHEGSSEALLSVIRGDTEIAVFPLGSVAEGIRAGDLKPLVIVGTAPGAENPDAEVVDGVPTLDEATGEEGLGSAIEQHRIIVAAPGTPSCVIDTLSDAMEATYDDAQFLSQVEGAGYVPAFLGAEETQEILENTIETLVEYRDLLTEALEG